jgi:hypothetical protein
MVEPDDDSIVEFPPPPARQPTPVEEFVVWLDQELIKLVKEKGNG